MDQLKTIFGLRLKLLKNKLRGVSQHSRLKIIVVWVMIAAIFLGTFYVPYRAFLFLRSMGHLGSVIIDRLLYLFFMGLFAMLVFSNCIICYSTSFKARETEYLFTFPLKYSSIFFVRFIDSVILSSWTFLCFLIPILSAYAVVRQLGWDFYVSLLIFFIPFAIIAAAGGSLVTMFVVRYLPRRLYRWLGILCAVIFVACFLWLIIKGRAIRQTENEVLFLLTNFIPHFGFSQFVFAPHYWISEGIFKVIAGNYKQGLFWWFLLLSNALFLGQLALFSATKIYYDGWTRSIFFGGTKLYKYGQGLLDKFAKRLFFLKPPMQALIVKDIKVFWRDPLQWSQFTIFFGLLAIYFANIRSLGYENILPFWKNIISFLNLASTNLTLASLSVRFVFPQFSLEGRKFWILGLAPIKKSSLLFEKFWLNSAAALCISLPLIVLSNFMLGVTSQLMFISSVLVILMCFSLTSLCTGLGAIFPNFKEDNPAQIVSGFGGTLALVLSLSYIALCVAAVGLPFHLLITEQIKEVFFHKLILAAGAFVSIVSILSVGLPMYFGCQALKKLEL